MIKSQKNKVFLIAEIGGNHEGNFEQAKKLTNLAIKAGADAVKYQIYTGSTLVNKLYSPERHKHFRRLELPIHQYIRLAKICKKRKVIFMASVWDEKIFEKIKNYIPIIKIGSGDLTHYSLIKKFLKTKKPIILSTGLSDIKQVDRVVEFIKKQDFNYIKSKKLTLLQCTSSYPTPNDEVNLLAIQKLKKRFNLPVGYSDHTRGNLACELAVSLGAEIIEVHFTDNKNKKTFRDHQVSMNYHDMKKFVSKVEHVKKSIGKTNEIKKLLGKKLKKITKSEIKSKHHISFRRSIYASRIIKKGEYIKESNIKCLRPVSGIKADQYFNILGKKVKKDINLNQGIKISDLK